jgi:LysM repeat protein
MVNVIFLTLLLGSNPAFPSDSLRMESINGKLFIIHQVSEHETLYGVSRRYGTPITAILEFNPKAASGLEVGQLLQIPYVPKPKPQSGDGSIHKVAAKETLFSVAKLYNVSMDDLKAWNHLTDYALSVGQELIVKKPPGFVGAVSMETPKSATGTHTVEPKETLFSIAKKYGITVQQLKDLNGITGADVKIGQVLIVQAAASVTNPMIEKPLLTTPVVKEEPKQEKIETVPTRTETVIGSDEVKEGGLAEVIDGTEGNRKYLALHRTAKAGAILKVRNELNNREVFVRVVGPLPATGVNDKLVIKISKSAFDRLGAIDPKFRVEVTYYK